MANRRHYHTAAEEMLYGPCPGCIDDRRGANQPTDDTLHDEGGIIHDKMKAVGFRDASGVFVVHIDDAVFVCLSMIRARRNDA